MPVKMRKIKGDSYENRTPHGVKGRHMTKANAEKQCNLLNAVEHSDWRPTGKPARKRKKAKK